MSLCVAGEKWVRRRGHSQAGRGQITWSPETNGRDLDCVLSTLEGFKQESEVAELKVYKEIALAAAGEWIKEGKNVTGDQLGGYYRVSAKWQLGLEWSDEGGETLPYLEHNLEIEPVGFICTGHRG